MKRLIATLALAIAMLFPASVSAHDPTVIPMTAEEAAQAEIAADLVRDEYHAYCAGPHLMRYRRHNEMAGWRVEDMSQHGWYDHDIYPDGSRWHDYYSDMRVYEWVSSGENVGITNHATPGARIFELWMASSAHRANIRGCSFDVYGIAANFEPSIGRWVFELNLTNQPERRAGPDGAGVWSEPTTSSTLLGKNPSNTRLVILQERVVSTGLWYYAWSHLEGYGWTKATVTIPY